MGIFDGILIASDWDGTLCFDHHVPEKTSAAVNYFMSEGGRFSVTSGRGPEYLRSHKHMIHPNTYCICYGGCLITDLESGEVIRRGKVDNAALEVVNKILLSGVDIKSVNVAYTDEMEKYSPEEYRSVDKSRLLQDKYKITFSCANAEEGARLKAFCDTLDYPEYTMARSFPPYLELMQTEYTKGVSARVVKEKIGARLLVGMGDHENDVPLFEKCDISFAVGNAEKCLKDIATFVTERTVRESAVAEVVERLEQMIRDGKI